MRYMRYMRYNRYVQIHQNSCHMRYMRYNRYNRYVQIHQNSAEMTRVGTLNWSAPEVVKGLAYDLSVDQACHMRDMRGMPCA